MQLSFPGSGKILSYCPNRVIRPFKRTQGIAFFALSPGTEDSQNLSKTLTDLLQLAPARRGDGEK